LFTTRFQAWVRRQALRAAARMQKLPVTPNQLTLLGFAITCAAAVLIALDHPFAGGLVLLFAAVFDIFDGALARATGRSYNFGAFLDSTTDRMSEGAIMVALVVLFERHGVFVGAVLVVLATIGSFLVSYVRARAQSLGFTADGGLLARPERVLLTVVGLLLTPISMSGLLILILVLAVFTNFTAIQRVWFVWRQSRIALQAVAGPSAPEAPRPATTAPPASAAPADGPRPKEEREVRPGPEPAGG
jgi:CDP-diacylglycerol---glycerol-3-phosphate 3-phosphatidyltransferase